MKNQALFSSKDKSKKLKCRLLQFLFDALRVKEMHNNNLLHIYYSKEVMHHLNFFFSALLMQPVSFHLNRNDKQSNENVFCFDNVTVKSWSLILSILVRENFQRLKIEFVNRFYQNSII